MDKEILEVLKDESRGRWWNDGNSRVYTPNMSAFEDVTPEEMGAFFDQHKDYRLDLP